MNQQSIRSDKLEEERFSIYQILKTYSIWATEFSRRRSKVMVYNSGMISILQRLLSFMSEDDAFWTLIGLTKGFKNVFNFEERESATKLETYESFCPLTNRKISFKNEMIILNSLIKVHFPEVFRHLKSLAMPIEWYFYESFTSFFCNVF